MPDCTKSNLAPGWHYAWKPRPYVRIVQQLLRKVLRVLLPTAVTKLRIARVFMVRSCQNAMGVNPCKGEQFRRE